MSVGFTEFRFPSASGCNTLRGGIWLGDAAKPRAALQLIHGMCEHIDRYDSFARYLAENGFVVYAHDHLGHGKSIEKPDQKGFFADKDGWQLVVEDAHTVTQKIRSDYPELPVFMLGHSMGSFILEGYLAKYGEGISGAIVSGTGGPNKAVGPALALCGMIGFFNGKKHYSKFIDDLAFGKYCERIQNAATDKDWLSRDPETVQKYVDDPLCGFLFTVSGYGDLFRMIRAATDPQLPSRIPKELPMLYIAGKEDPVGNYGEGPQIMYARMRDAGIKDVALKLYDGMRHETLNEVGREQVYADLLKWLNAHMEKKD